MSEQLIDLNFINACKVLLFATNVLPLTPRNHLSDSFINDTSQLGYTQDDLDHVNADAEVEVCNHGESVHHRQFDHQHNVDHQFKTPVFNRRMKAPGSESQHSMTSQKGLGNMNFIKNVLEVSIMLVIDVFVTTLLLFHNF